MVSLTHAANVTVYQRAYDLVRDFAPVTQLGNPELVVVHPSMPVKSVPDLVRLARAKPGAIALLRRWEPQRSGNGAVQTSAGKHRALRRRGGGAAMTALMV
jgi:tripartite-type tricarboxylate transporter receptor subunit TctC